MGRRKQIEPRRSIRSRDCIDDEKQIEPQSTSTSDDEEPLLVGVDRSSWISDDHVDISEILLSSLNVSVSLSHDFYRDPKYDLRFRLWEVNEYDKGRIRVGKWPCSLGRISLELVEDEVLILSGSLDGPNEGVSALVHLVSIQFLSLRLISSPSSSSSCISVRVEMLENAFNACESLADNSRQVWRKSMMNLMAWLHPHVITSEARYGLKVDDDQDANASSASFDAAAFYESIKPSKTEPMLEDEIPELVPQLRPYQRRAVYWMIQRERGRGDDKNQNHLFSPLCIPLHFADTTTIFYNPFCGNVSLHPENSTTYVSGGILADEMGLGKTVELLACIFANRKTVFEGGNNSDELQVSGNHKVNLKRLRRERVECTCGVVTESPRYKGLWVQCDVCDAWQHADCVDYTPAMKVHKFIRKKMGNSQKENNAIQAIDDEDYICPLCLELMKATESPVASGATLIVCPASILPQWRAEIIRHTNPGSLKTCIYDGVRSTALSNVSAAMDIGQLLSADVVLTTYDVLRGDLSHDSDRNEGDRRLMRFQKRYPVIPTPLTRILWWRICLDEAQMVESNSGAATEMIMRLHAKHRWCITGTPIQRRLDDLYGLLNFLKASPFDISKWWVEVIRDPYERKNLAAQEFTHKLFKQIMWRSSKIHVADELQLPPQEQCLSWLSFSAIEEHFYRRQHETCVCHAHEVIERLKDDAHKRRDPGSVSSDPFITHVEASKLLHSLLKLRQACCHPQVGSSGLRSLQQSPMSMDEILSVLVRKTKIEGEEALRALVCSLNGLAGIAVIECDLSRAALLYREALSMTEKYSEDFRLDPLLNIHIHYNLAEMASKSSRSLDDFGKCDQHTVKRRKLSKEDPSGHITDPGKSPAFEFETLTNSLDSDKDSDPAASRPSCEGCLRMKCENMKNKYLFGLNSKLSVAQQEFRKSYVQVCDAIALSNRNKQSWWLEALEQVEQNEDSLSKLIRMIGEAFSEDSSRTASRFRSITALKYHVQTGLDSLLASRKILLERLLEIDGTMENPRDEDVERVRCCPICYANSDGPLCVHCEIDTLFKDYEARLFFLKKDLDGRMIASAEEALALQKKNSERNQFFWTLSQTRKNATPTSIENEENKMRRDVAKNVSVSKNPSELEVVLGVIKRCSKVQLGGIGMSAATKQMQVFEGMRKEYRQARSLAIAQAQVLHAHDEIKMAMSRLRLKENDNDESIDALSEEQLIAASMENTSEKFLSLASLSRIHGQLRYLKGLVQSKQKQQLEGSKDSSVTEDTITSLKDGNGCLEEDCPICQDKVNNQKMVFQCGHITCCKCFFVLVERGAVHRGILHDKWVMCPTCRLHTDFRNIAYADDRHERSYNSTFRGYQNSEDSITVQGSYGTKIEAVTRRILWIKGRDPKAKVLVFSSWNDVLDVLEHALSFNHITFIRMKGGRKAQAAISQFKEEREITEGRSTQEKESVQVLLLLVQHGANGLNLLEAQHVVLIEPLLNPAAEAQAISRVHRIGQQNPTLVHRFMVKNTVEESIYRLNRSKKRNSFISGNTKNQDQPVLTLKELESLFANADVQESNSSECQTETDSLMHLPPSVAAVVAAERRFNHTFVS